MGGGKKNGKQVRIKALGNITPVVLSEWGWRAEKGSSLGGGSRGMSRKTSVCLRSNQKETSCTKSWRISTSREVTEGRVEVGGQRLV